MNIATRISNNLKEKKETITIIEKTYLFAYIMALGATISFFTFEESRIPAFFTIFVLLTFAFSILNDAIENSKHLFNYTAYKLLGSIFISIAITIVLIKTYQDVNAITGVDPALLGFTTSLVFIVNMISLSSFIIGAIFMILLAVLSVFIPFLISFFSTTKKEKKEKKPWGIMTWTSRFIALFCIYVLGNMFSPNGLLMNKIAPDLMTDLVLYADFNSKHNCIDTALVNKPVLFLQKGFVLVYDNKNFAIKDCY